MKTKDSMRRCLLTGVSGFLGSHVLDHILVNTDWYVVGIASWRHKGIPERIVDSVHYQAHKDRVEILTHDLTAPFTQVTKDKIGKVDYIIQVASDSHVDRSIEDPRPFIENNVKLILSVLDFAREIKPRKVFVVSTDETVGAQKEGEYAREWDTQLPSNPYAASKAAQENIAFSYWRTYGLPITIGNAQNLIGERQDSEKFTPKIIRSVLNGEELTIHADPKTNKPGRRVYLHCRNYADAILWSLTQEQQFFPEFDKPNRYHIAGDQDLDNLQYAQLIAEIMGKPLKYRLVDAHSSRPGHDPIYLMSGEKIRSLGWEPPFGFRKSLEKTINWYMENSAWLK